MVVTLTLSRSAWMTGTIRSLATGDVLSIAARNVAEGEALGHAQPVAPGRYRLHLTLAWVWTTRETNTAGARRWPGTAAAAGSSSRS